MLRQCRTKSRTVVHKRNYKRNTIRVSLNRWLMAFGWSSGGSLKHASHRGINLIPKTASSRYAGKLHPTSEILRGEGEEVAFILIYANNMAYISRILSYFYGDARLSASGGILKRECLSPFIIERSLWITCTLQSTHSAIAVWQSVRRKRTTARFLVSLRFTTACVCTMLRYNKEERKTWKIIESGDESIDSFLKVDRLWRRNSIFLKTEWVIQRITK